MEARTLIEREAHNLRFILVLAAIAWGLLIGVGCAAWTFFGWLAL